MNRSTALTLLSLALLAACDNTPPPSDGGQGDAGPPDGASDTEAPTIEETIPTGGADEVAPSVTMYVRFSEPMDTSAGAVSITADGSALDAPALTWSSDARELRIGPAASLPSPAEVMVALDATFRDPAGNALAGERTFSFRTADRVAPHVVTSAPAEGATAVSVATGAITITFDEPMDTTRGRLVLDGGTLGAATWTDDTLTVAVSGLSAETEHHARLVGFADRAGNLLDEAAYLGDGAIDFTTGPDDQAPVIVSSDPMEGQLDVAINGLTRVIVDFSEPMDPSAGAATLTVYGESAPLALSFTDDGRRALLDVAGRLASHAPHTIALSGFRDLAGNAFDASAYLGDGALDFTTGEDAFVPFVAFTSPAPGSSDVDDRITDLAVVFSERMDTTLDTITLDNGEGRLLTLRGTWGSTGTYLRVPLAPGDLLTGFSYSVDLTGFRDSTGTALDAAHPYLGDGVLRFSTVSARTGERCGDALTIHEATATATGYRWTIASGAVTTRDGGFACDTSGAGDDALVYYRKTSADSAGGGSVLHVTVAYDTASTDIDVEVFAGSCVAAGASADANRRRCLWDGGPWETYLDVGPGDYFVWVAPESSTGTFAGATITIEEITPAPEGESCASPWSTATTDPAVYTPPATPSDPHVFTLAASSAVSLDRTVSHDTAPFSCAPADLAGSDAVVRFDKATDTSVLTVDVEPASSTYYLDVDVGDGCDPASATRTEYACESHVSGARREMTVRGPAGPRFVWLSTPRQTVSFSTDWRDFPGATVRITEVEPAAGDSCATAIPITAGTSIAITPDRPYRVDAPSCTTTGVTWYRYTASQGLGIVRAASGAAIGAIEASSGDAIRCATETSSAALPVMVAPGTDVCLAVASSGSATTLSIDERPYTGVRGVATDLGITYPSTYFPPTLNFMVVTPTKLYTGGNDMAVAPRSGGAELTTFDPTGALPGEQGVAIGEAVYTISTAGFNPTTPQSLVYQVVDATGAPTLVPIDTTPVYASTSPLGTLTVDVDGANFLLASDTPTTAGVTYFYSLPIAGGTPTQIGSNATLQDVSAITSDATYVYVTANVGDTSSEGIYRLRRDELANPAATPFLVYSGGMNYSDQNGAMYLGSSGGTTWMYFRTYGPRASVHLLIDPDTDTPIYLGELWAPTSNNQTGMAYDPAAPALFVYDRSPTPDQWLRID